MTNTTIPSMRGLPLPNLEAHGLARKMRPAATLIAEQDKLRQRASELGHERQRLEEEIREAPYQHTAAWGEALRAGEEAPSSDAIEAATKRLKAIREEEAAVTYAGELADAELKQTVAEHREEWDALVQAKGQKILAEAQQMADALSAKLRETEGLVGVHTWLESSGQFYTPAMAGSVSIDTLLHERMHALGLLEAKVVG